MVFMVLWILWLEFNLEGIKTDFRKAHDISNTITILRFGMFGTEVSTAFCILKAFLLGDEILIQIFDNKYLYLS